MGFTPGVTANLSSIDFVIELMTGTNEINLALVSDNQGFPGATLESWTFTNQMQPTGTVGAVLIADSVLNPLLQAGTSYWLVASAPISDTYAQWNSNSIGNMGRETVSADGGSTWGTVIIPIWVFFG